MKKRLFMLPLAGAVAALAAGGGTAVAKPESPTASVSPTTEATTPVAPLVLHRGTSTNVAQYHSSHASHASHASHYSSHR